MRIGKAIDHSHDVGVVSPRMPLPPSTKVKYAVLAAVPVALVVGAVLKAKKGEPARTGRTAVNRSCPPKDTPKTRRRVRTLPGLPKDLPTW
jgi:hypothetical protein